MTRLKLVIAWLLLAAIPSQGFAAATMAFCGIGHEPSVSARLDQAVSHGSTASNTDHHGSQATKPGHEHVEHLKGTDSADAKGDKCSACAACCHAVSLVSDALEIQMLAFGSALCLPPLEKPMAYINAGLERPPRFFLA